MANNIKTFSKTRGFPSRSAPAPLSRDGALPPEKEASKISSKKRFPKDKVDFEKKILQIFSKQSPFWKIDVQKPKGSLVEKKNTNIFTSQ